MIDALRRAGRQVARAPGWALAVVATLALAIGANTAAFSLVNAMVLRPLSLEDPDRLVLLEARGEREGTQGWLYHSTVTELATLPVFEHLALYSGGGAFRLEARGIPHEGLIESSTHGLFEAIGTAPFLGRFYTAADSPADGAGAAVAVISHAFWLRAFEGDPRAVGETILVSGTQANRVPVTVIGVTPPDFTGFYVDYGFAVAVPLTFLTREITPTRRPLAARNAVGRLADGVSLAQARAAVDAVWPALRAGTVPAGLPEPERLNVLAQRITVASLETGISSLRGRYREPLLIVAGITAALLLIGCVNVGGLILSRVVERKQQLAIRLALGASRGRLLRGLLLETGMLCAAGAGVAVLLAWWITHAATSMLNPADVPLANTLTPDARVLWLTAAIALAVALVVTIAPWWQMSRLDGRESLDRRQWATAGRGRWSQALLAGQVALSFVLLVAAGLLASSLFQLRTLDTGVRPEGLRWARLFVLPGGYQDLHDQSYYPELVRQVSEIPGVRSVALAQMFPTLFGTDVITPLLFPVARAGTQDSEAADAIMERISPAFFETTGIPIARGRDFTWLDDRQRPAVAIINESLARLLFRDRDPIGQRIRIGTDPSRADVEVIGVARGATIGTYKQPNQPVVFRPRMQDAVSPRNPVLLARTSGDLAAVDAAMTRAIEAFGHEYPRRLSSLEEQIDRALVRERLLASVSGFFGALGVVLAFVGLYSTLAYSVASRTREMSIRLAVGATRPAIARLVLQHSLRPAVAGIAVGVAAALLGGRALSAWLFGVEAADPRVLLGAAAFFVLIGVAAGLRPAVRACRVDPATVLRPE